MIAVWDDHEFDNNANSEGSASTGPEDWPRRRAEAKQAYHEWLPTDVLPEEPLYRHFSFGGLVDLFMLDTRVEGRTPQLYRRDFIERFNPERKLLGDTQENWLHNGLRESSATQDSGQQ